MSQDCVQGCGRVSKKALMDTYHNSKLRDSDHTLQVIYTQLLGIT